MDEILGRLSDEKRGLKQIDELIGEVREEAVAEARIILKNRLVQAILDRALSSPPPEGDRGARWPGEASATGRTPTTGERGGFISHRAAKLQPIAAKLRPIATELRPIAAELPSMAAELPAIAAQQPSIATELPSIATELPSLAAGFPSLAAERRPVAAESRPAGAEPDSKARILQEIESIRQKIAENDRFLSGGSVSPGQPGKASPEPAPKGNGDVSPQPESQTPAAPELGYYVYCIVQNDDHLPGEQLPEHGMDLLHPVYTIAQQGLAAVVSQVSLDEFGQEELEANLTDLQWLESKVRVHQTVLETVLASRVCVPMRLCTIYRDAQRVQALMTEHYADFVSTLERLQGKQEWSVKVYCDSQALAGKVGEVSARVQELAAQINGKSGGAAYFLKKKMEQAIAEEVERIGDETAQHSLDCLAEHAEAAVTNSLQDQETTQRQDDMLLNAAYLVPDDQLAAFQVELESLQSTYGAQGFSFEMTGPWPPYNFATINLEKVSVA